MDNDMKQMKYKLTSKLTLICLIFISFITNADNLYENGPMVTSIGTGLNGEDESVLQFASLGMNQRGFSNQTRFDNRLADDFTIDNEYWKIETITFYTFVTGASVPTVSEIYLQIWDGAPGEVGSNVIFGDLLSNRLNTSINTHILRVIEADSGINDDRQISANIADVNIILPAGTYWLDWSTEGTNGAGPYAPPIALTGQLVTGNSLRFNNNEQWEDTLDLGSKTQQGFPFIIEGSIIDMVFENGFETLKF